MKTFSTVLTPSRPLAEPNCQKKHENVKIMITRSWFQSLIQSFQKELDKFTFLQEINAGYSSLSTCSYSFRYWILKNNFLANRILNINVRKIFFKIWGVAWLTIKSITGALTTEGVWHCHWSSGSPATGIYFHRPILPELVPPANIPYNNSHFNDQTKTETNGSNYI